MKKKKLKIFRQLVRNLPEIREGEADYFVLVGHERNEYDKLTGKKKYEMLKGIPVNHARRIKRAYQRGGGEEIGRYLDRVRRFEQETKKLTPLLEQQPR